MCIRDRFWKGFQEGYLTMDLLAFIAIGTIVIEAIKAKGVEKPRDIGRLCITAGLISAGLMSLVYLALSYLGASSTAALGISENGGVILTKMCIRDSSAMVTGMPMNTVLEAVNAVVKTPRRVRSTLSMRANKTLAPQLSRIESMGTAAP